MKVLLRDFYGARMSPRHPKCALLCLKAFKNANFAIKVTKKYLVVFKNNGNYMFNLMNFPVAFLISISMNYATKLSTGCRQICRCCGTRTDRQIWIKLRCLLSYCRFLSAPYSRLFNAAQDLELTVQQFTLEGGSVLGGWKCRGRALLSREGGTVGVVPVVACEGV